MRTDDAGRSAVMRRRSAEIKWKRLLIPLVIGVPQGGGAGLKGSPPPSGEQALTDSRSTAIAIGNSSGAN
ncbi:unnamed protein product [Gadus morhua 'NCC']